MLTLSNVASIHRAIRQQEGAAAVDRTIVYGRRKIVDIFGTACDGRCALHERCWHKIRSRSCRDGSWEGVGSLVAGGDGVLPLQWQIWSQWRKSCHRWQVFWLIVVYFSPRGARDSRFWLRSGRRKRCPRATTLLNPWKRCMNIANFLPRGLISTMVALRKIGAGGAGPGGCFSSLTVRIC